MTVGSNPPPDDKPGVGKFRIPDLSKLEVGDFDLDPDDLDPDKLEELGLSDGNFEDPEPIDQPPWESLRINVLANTVARKLYPNIPFCMMDRFELVDVVGSGGMGIVFSARDTELDRPVAIKLWKATDPEAQAALLEEARMLAKLSHPNIVAVYETGRYEGQVYFVMELVEGEDGHAWLSTPRHWREVQHVYIEAGKGLAVAHDAGVLHRDFKPGNILIGADGRVRVADFGLAESLDSPATEATEEGRMPGTKQYMAPERLRGEPGDACSDQFSFCVAMWHALFGVRPYEGGTREELLEAIEGGVVTCSRRADPVPPWLSRAVGRGLLPDRERRYPNMHELIAALENEPPSSDQLVHDASGEDAPDGSERVLHAPAAVPGRSTRQDWRGIGAFMAGTLMAFSFALAWKSLDDRVKPESTQTSPGHEPVRPTTEPQPVDEVLALVEAGEFVRARTRWFEVRKDLTPEESLTIARASVEALERAPMKNADLIDSALFFVTDINTSLSLTEDEKIRAESQQLWEELMALYRSNNQAW